MRLNYRKMTDEDVREICDWHYEGRYQVYDMPPFELMAYYQVGLMNPKERNQYYVYFDNQQLIGFTSVEMRKDKLCVAIGVHPNYLNQGYGQEIFYLIDELYDYECLYLEVRIWNERAKACYEKAGFEIVGKPYLRILEGKPVLFHEMKKVKLCIPDFVKQRALSLGEIGEKWLKNIHYIVNILKIKWNFSIEEVINGGSHALVCLVDSNKTLKIEIPDHSESSFMASVEALRLAKGHGYVYLYEYDLDYRAVLLERLGLPLSKLDYSVDSQLKLLTDALKQTWDMPLERTHLNNGLSSIEWFETYVHERKDKLDKNITLRFNEYLNKIRTTIDETEFVLVHGDGHNNNLLQRDNGSFKFIDPDGMYFEKAYDLGVLMREYIDEYLVDPLNLGIKRSRLLSELCNVDEMRIFMWGYLHMVATALILLDMKQDELANKMLFIALKWFKRNS